MTITFLLGAAEVNRLFISTCQLRCSSTVFSKSDELLQLVLIIFEQINHSIITSRALSLLVP